MSKLSSPLPQTLQKECSKAIKIFRSFVDSRHNGLDGVIPRSVLSQAKGFAIFTIVKAGFIFSARAGSGVVIAKLSDGSWSAPSAIGTAGVGAGMQAGAEVTDFLVVLNSRSAVTSFMSAGSLTLGGNMSIALGPLGRNGEATGAVNTKGKVAAMYSYSKTRGLFGGVSLEGSVIVERQDANAQAYRSPVTARMLLGGTVDRPEWAMPLISVLESCTTMPSDRDWIQEHNRHSSERPYVFGDPNTGVSAVSRSSSLFGRGKKDRPDWPPPSWSKQDYPNESSPTDYYNASSRRSASLSYNNNDSALRRERERDDLLIDISDSPRQTNPFASPSPSVPDFPRTASEEEAARAAADLFTTNRSKPVSRVEIAKRPELDMPLSPNEGIARAIALYEFKPVEPGDLGFGKGDIITVTKMSDSVDDWWTGKLRGQQGIFPANFVELA